MYVTKKTANRCNAFTLVELLVVIAIILALSALAAAFAPRVSDNQNLSRAVDNLEQWLLTAKMRAKRDGLATGVRFMQTQGDAAGTYSQVQYIQQPDPLSGYPGTKTLTAANGMVTFSGEDFSLGGAPQFDAYGRPQWLVQSGDYLEVRDGGVYVIGAVTSPFTLTLAGTAYDTTLSVTFPTSNYRILRQPRVLIGEEPLALPNNFAVDMRTSGYVNPGTVPSNYQNPAGWNQNAAGPSSYYDIVFSPTGTVVGANASNGIIAFVVYDMTMNPYDSNRVGIVAVKGRTGFIGAYSVAAGADPFAFAESGQESGL